jgi:hypothetical protein
MCSGYTKEEISCVCADEEGLTEEEIFKLGF